MKRTKIKLTKDRRIFVKQSTVYVISLVGEISFEGSIEFIQKAENINIEVYINSFLEGNSGLVLEVLFRNYSHNNIGKYNLQSRVIIDGNSSATIRPILIVGSKEYQANHKLSVGGIDSAASQYLNTKGLDRTQIKKLIKESFINF
ncbi:MAG: hypothetical protein UT34_C0001G0151 [candidate division WS6 bacterium GW2011_GWF2_39_15]|uniref:Uncharacterized protein n=1 Tax=candidate division WS6 bacterium GW2011_GWF2_39_15 TaxID=1619100 RepID=A0A0G0MZY8_9BACT|nr:MAG: hypothetical protein UT34_C0001G0151 [candidate division WS6 bacterium GW2011_GWF2_39_15]